MQQVEGAHWRSLSDSLHVRMEDVGAERGTIYSEDGEMLSTSIPRFDVFIDFAADGLREKNGRRFRENVDSLSYCLAKLFKDKSEDEYARILNNGYKSKSRYFSLRKKMSFREYQQLREFPLVRLGRNKSGFIFDSESIRLNPYQQLAFRTIGLDRRNAQKVGLEQTYDSILEGQTGKRLVRYIAGGVRIPVDEDNQIEPENGKDIITTLNMQMQEVAESALMNMMIQSESESGCVIVMEVKTGKIKAIANLGRQSDGTYTENYNYALRTSEPGSTIKLATLLAGLSEGADINSPLQIGNSLTGYVGVRSITDDHFYKPVMTVKEAFAQSSNIGMARLGYNTFASQPKKFLDYLHKFRLDQRTGIDLLGEPKPLLPKMTKSNEGLHAMVTMSFGYAIQISPLQTLMLYNAVANNGKMMQPYLVTDVLQNGVSIKKVEPVVIDEAIASPEVIKAAQESLHQVTVDGTAKGIFAKSGFDVAGKTGTAHVADGKYKYEDGVYQASFAGYFPYQNPQYSCIVVIKTKPHVGLHFGGQLAAPVFRTIAERLHTLYIREAPKTETKIEGDSSYYKYAGSTKDFQTIMKSMNAKYNSSNISAAYASFTKQGSRANIDGYSVNKNTMPSLQNLTLKDALAMCEEAGLKVNTNGVGRVRSQSIAEGQTIRKGDKINIELN